MVVAEDIARAVTHGCGPETHAERAPLVVAVDDGGFLDVVRPLRVLLDVERGRVHEVGGRADGGALGRLLGHTESCHTRGG